MIGSNLNQLLARLERIGTGTSEQDTDSLFMELDAALLEYDDWPHSYFDRVASLLSSSEFLRQPHSWRVLKLFSDNWSQLSDLQVARLRPLLVSSATQHADWMGAFVTFELLGEHYCDSDALSFFVRLSQDADPQIRGLVPHGLETLARKSRGEPLFDNTVKQLMLMTLDAEDAVRTEAQLALSKIHPPPETSG